MARETTRRSKGRRSPWAAAALIGIGLLITGGVYAGASAAMAATTPETTVNSALAPPAHCTRTRCTGSITIEPRGGL